VRLKNINLKMTLKKLENNLRAKEQLAEGLHLIDFEQLKIENQTLNEKIEERNEELHKLRKKNTTTVQVLTHIKEKLQAVQADNGVVRAQLTDLDGQLGVARDRLNKLKREREIVRNENAVLKQKQGFANSTLLVVDFETRKTKLQEARSQLAELMERHEILLAVTQQTNAVTQGGQ
jgi:chromosome segregation ATPase